MSAVAATALTAGEARELTDRIRDTAGALRDLLLEAYARGAWTALGYASWRDYATAELSISKSRAYQLLDQAKVIAAITEAANSTDVEITEAVARDIKPVLPEVTAEIKVRVDAGEEPAEVVRAVVEQKREERKLTLVESTPDEDEEDAPEEDHAPDLATELEHAHREITQLTALVDSLSASDLGAEVKLWQVKYAQLEGRLQQELTTSREAKGQAKYQGDLLKKIRTELGVAQSQQILPAIRALRTEVAA